MLKSTSPADRASMLIRTPFAPLVARPDKPPKRAPIASRSSRLEVAGEAGISTASSALETAAR